MGSKDEMLAVLIMIACKRQKQGLPVTVEKLSKSLKANVFNIEKIANRLIKNNLVFSVDGKSSKTGLFGCADLKSVTMGEIRSLFNYEELKSLEAVIISAVIEDKLRDITLNEIEQKLTA